MRLALFAILSLASLSTGCGKEAGRVSFTAKGTNEATMSLEAKEVAFWTDLDIEWEGEASAEYDVELQQKGESVGTATCDPLARASVRMSWVETNINGHHTRSGRAKMACTATIAHAGETTIKAKLKASNVTIKKADLVLKQ